MKRKLNCILLIDDDESTNFLNELVIKHVDCTEKVVVVQSGREGLNYLRSIHNGQHPQPELIFLDINMPAMNGWEFLEEYGKLDELEKGKVILVMLTTSNNPDDQAKAQTINKIQDFHNKPLTAQMLQKILRTHFADLW